MFNLTGVFYTRTVINIVDARHQHHSKLVESIVRWTRGVTEYLAISKNARWMLLNGVTGELPLLDNESVALKSSGIET